MCASLRQRKGKNVCERGRERRGDWENVANAGYGHVHVLTSLNKVWNLFFPLELIPSSSASVLFTARLCICPSLLINLTE